ncbi:MAG: 30S ribosomal protein S18 [Malacoplasma sp.]|nr:30S ribosomal protein S18 [Malacoplasma sp.]
MEHVDYKDVDLLKKYLTYNYKIASRKVTSSCLKHQIRVSNAIKRARIVALIPFTEAE